MGLLFLVWYPLLPPPPPPPALRLPPSNCHQQNCHQPIVTNQLPPTNCHQPIVINRLSSTTCHQRISNNLFNNQLSSSGCHQPIVSNQLSTTNCHQLPPTNCHQPILTYQLSPTTCHQPIVTNQFSPSVNNQLSSTDCHQPVVTDQLSTTNVFSRGSHVRPGAGWRWLGLLGLRRCAAVICVAGAVLGALQGVGCTPWRWLALAGAAGHPALCRCDLRRTLVFSRGSDVRPGAAWCCWVSTAVLL